MQTAHTSSTSSFYLQTPPLPFTDTRRGAGPYLLLLLSSSWQHAQQQDEEHRHHRQLSGAFPHNNRHDERESGCCRGVSEQGLVTKFTNLSRGTTFTVMDVVVFEGGEVFISCKTNNNDTYNTVLLIGFVQRITTIYLIK